MATKIVTKNSSTAGSAPLASDLVQGELAVNVTDKRLYTEDNAGAVVELGTNPSTLTVTGEITANGGIALGDGDKATFGAGDDLQIYHDGSGSYIDDAGTGNLFVRADNLQLRRADGSHLYLAANTGAEVALYHAGNSKLATTSTGIDVTGTATMDGLTVDGNVGIGTSSPAYELDVKSSGETDIRIDSATGNDGALRFAENSTNVFTMYHDAANSALAFYDNTNTSERMRIDSSGNVGIGTAAPASMVGGTANTAILTVGGGDGSLVTGDRVGAVSFKSDDATYKNTFADGIVGEITSIVESASGSTYGLAFSTGNAATSDRGERMRIDSSGNVGIGTTSVESIGGSMVTTQLKGKTTTRGGGLRLSTSDSAHEMLVYVADGLSYVSSYTNHPLIFQTNNAERMRIDSSGDLLVNTTASGVWGNATQSVNDNGHSLRNDGIHGSAAYKASANVGYVQYLNRTGSDGGIAAFYKNGATVGSIGTAGGDLTVGTGDTGITFEDSADVIHPITQSSGAARDGAIDLGKSAARFKDLYLSGGVSTNTSAGLSITANSSNRGILNLSTSTAYQLIGGAYYGYTGYKTGGYHRFFGSDGSEDMRIDSSGNLLVGTTTTPTFAGLAVGSTSAGKNISVFSSVAGSNGIVGVYQPNGTQEGQFYAGTGSANLFGTSVVKVTASTAGVQLSSGATSWTAISDERKKDIIEPIINAAQKVSTLRAVIGKYKTDTEGTRRSFLIAQDIQAVFPEAVDATDEDNLGVRYTETIPLLVSAIQEQQTLIETLTARIAALEV